MKHNVSTKFKLYLSIIALLLLSLIKAQAQFDFTVVNNTGYENDPVHGFYKIQGYEHRYRLTSEEPWQSVAMWGNTKIDLTQDFIFDMRLNFGGNNSLDPQGREKGADGFVFVMHQLNPNALIGRAGGYIGYGYTVLPNLNITNTSALDSINHITNMLLGNAYTPIQMPSSFAVEFDTYSWGNEDCDEQNHPTNSHISYLKNSSMAAINGTKQLQDNWLSVEDGNWYCVRIQSLCENINFVL